METLTLCEYLTVSLIKDLGSNNQIAALKIDTLVFLYYKKGDLIR